MKIGFIIGYIVLYVCILYSQNNAITNNNSTVYTNNTSFVNALSNFRESSSDYLTNTNENKSNNDADLINESTLSNRISESIVLSVESEMTNNTNQTWFIYDSWNSESSLEIKRVLVLPFENNTSEELYTSSENLGPFFFRSMYNLIRLVPEVDIPDNEFLMETRWTDEYLPAFVESNKVDLVISGEYEVGKNGFNTEVTMHIRVWSGDINDYKMDETYSAPVDLDIFDEIDVMVEDAVEVVLERRITYGNLVFRKFTTGDYLYSIYINNKKMDVVSNESFSLNLRLMAENEYDVEIVREFDNRTVYDEIIYLEPDSTEVISYKEPFGIISFTNFSIGDGVYHVQVDEETIASISNEDFSKKLKLLPDYSYQLEIIRESDAKTVYDESIYLESNDFKTVSYEATGTLQVEKLNNNVFGRNYEILLDGQPITANTNIIIDANQTHIFSIIEDSNTEVFNREFYLPDDGTNIISPQLDIQGGASFIFTALDQTMLRLGLDYFMGGRLFAGVNIGASVIPLSMYGIEGYANPLLFSFGGDFGFYFYGFKDNPLRIGIVIDGRYQMMIIDETLADTIAGSPDINMNSVEAGGGLLIEYSVFLLKAGAYYDLMNNELTFPVISAGLRF